MKKLFVTVMLLCMLLLSAAAAESSVPFGLDDTVIHEGLCEMSGLYAEVLDDAAMADGWYYYYTDTDQSPATDICWTPADGCYTTAEVLFCLKNTSGKAQSFGDKITARMIIRQNDAAQPDCYTGTVFQQNPGQTDVNGQIIMWSTKPAAIAPGECANASFRFDIPQPVYELMCAAAVGENTDITELCEFDFGDGIVYVIDLTDVLILASRYGIE